MSSRYIPVHIPDAFSSNPLSHVFPDPGKLSNGTAALLLAFIKWHTDFSQTLYIVQNVKGVLNWWNMWTSNSILTD